MTNDLIQARIAVNVIALLVEHQNDLGVLVYVGNITAELRNLFGTEFINWELISGNCDEREYSILNHINLHTLNKTDFNEIINKIEGRCGQTGIKLINEFLKNIS